MAKRILKYHLRGAMAKNHKFLHAGLKDGDYFVWAEVDDNDQELINSPYRMIGTGLVHPSWLYKCTIINGDLVWHIYDNRGVE